MLERITFNHDILMDDLDIYFDLQFGQVLFSYYFGSLSAPIP